jgi:hypothetical protein
MGGQCRSIHGEEIDDLDRSLEIQDFEEVYRKVELSGQPREM